MTQYAFHPDARDDLDEIWDYIAADNPDAADRVIKEILDAIRAAVSFPHSGHRRPDLTAAPLRFLIVREYLIAFAEAIRPSAPKTHRRSDRCHKTHSAALNPAIPRIFYNFRTENPAINLVLQEMLTARQLECLSRVLSKKVMDLCGKAGFKPRIVQEANGVIAIVGLVAGGTGISIQPESVKSIAYEGVVYRRSDILTQSPL